MVRYSGVLGVEEPHQSIPNLVVKLDCGDDTVGEVLWKNSSTPGCLTPWLGKGKFSFLEGTPGNRSSGDGGGPVTQRIRARGYEPRCRGFESVLAHPQPAQKGSTFTLGVGKS
ncbi:hypothetical protein OROHE_027379 [Orobanche hederae]